MNGISSIGTQAFAPPSTAEVFGSKQQPAFKNLLLEGLDQVNSMQQNADVAVEQLITGGDANPAEVLTAVQKADMAFRMMMQLRNKLVQAYQEIKEIRI